MVSSIRSSLELEGVAVDLAHLGAQRLDVVRAQIGLDRLRRPACRDPRQAQPRCVSRIWPTFMRLGTPSGLSTMSTCVPSSRNGMSSTGTILRDDALVAVTAGHLVARLDLALHGDEDLDHLHHAGRQFVAALQLLDLVEEALFEALLRLSSYCFWSASISAMQLVVGDREGSTTATADTRPASRG